VGKEERNGEGKETREERRRERGADEGKLRERGEEKKEAEN